MAEIPNDIPGNSKKQQQTAVDTGSKSTEKPPIPVFEGPSAGVKRRNSHPFWRWFRRMFLSDRKPKDILIEIVEQRIVPGIKDNVRNSAMATIDSFIYPGTSAAPVSTQNGITSYNKIFNNQSTKSNYQQPAQQQTKQDELNKGFSNPCFKHRNTRSFPDGHKEGGAEEFLALMKGYDYPTLSVHTMYMMQGKHIDYTWDAYGWNQSEIQALGPGNIRQTGNAEWPWMIVLPEAHVIS